MSPAAANLARVARSIDKWVHMGRVNSGRRYRYAHEVTEACSVDGTYLTRGPDKLLPNALAWRRAALTEMPAFTAQDYAFDPYDGCYDLASPRAVEDLSSTPMAEQVLTQLGLFAMNEGVESYEQLAFA
ncbi:hypothetical protein [Nonomuraea dietziae]|uniref:hypothetical protein n=1 Tax=Nonomuraea dietziae TaxID=65515 RepID=UPI0033F48D75